MRISQYQPELFGDKYVLQRRASLARLLTGATVLDYKTLPLVLDVHDEKLDITKLDGKIQAIRAKFGEVDDQPWTTGDSVAKFCYSNWSEYVQNGADLRIPVDGYFFHSSAWMIPRGSDPMNWPNDVDPVVRVFRRMIPLSGRTPPRIVWWDVERWWSSYTQYYQLIRTNPGGISRISPIWIVKGLQASIERIRTDQKAGNLPDFKMGIYTSPGFVSTYAPDLDGVLQWYLQWIATYPTSISKILPLLQNLDDLRARGIPVQGSKPMELGGKPADSWQYGCNAVFGDGAVTDRDTGKPCAVDVSIDLNPSALPGGVIPPPPPPPPPVEEPDLTELKAQVAALKVEVGLLNTFRSNVKES